MVGACAGRRRTAAPGWPSKICASAAKHSASALLMAFSRAPGDAPCRRREAARSRRVLFLAGEGREHRQSPVPEAPFGGSSDTIVEQAKERVAVENSRSQLLRIAKRDQHRQFVADPEEWSGIRFDGECALGSASFDLEDVLRGDATSDGGGRRCVRPPGPAACVPAARRRDRRGRPPSCRECCARRGSGTTRRALRQVRGFAGVAGRRRHRTVWYSTYEARCIVRACRRRRRAPSRMRARRASPSGVFESAGKRQGHRVNPERVRPLDFRAFVERRCDRGERSRIALIEEMQRAVPAIARAQRRALCDVQIRARS